MNPESITGTCRQCNLASPDLMLVGCGCCLHVSCTPLALICSSASNSGGIPSPVTEPLDCPVCHCGTVNGIELFPLSMADLEIAIDMRSKGLDDTSKKRPRDDDTYHQIQAESSYWLLNNRARTRSDHHNHRTGRWSNEEVAFVDALVAGFDRGELTLPYGLRLNEFLGDMLLCKSSRLTKKMKNASLSSRSYTFGSLAATTQVGPSLAVLQHQFLRSLSWVPMHLELRFNMVKLWRTYFSNLCLQVGYELLDARRWLSSLDDMEARAADADDYVRKARRRRLGSALRNDVGNTASSGVFIGGRPANETTPGQVNSMAQGGPFKPITFSHDGPSCEPFMAVISDASENADMDEMDMLVNALDASMKPRSGSMDWNEFDNCSLDEQNIEPLPQLNEAPDILGDCGPFLDQVIQYMEAEQGPFAHADIWVPSSVDGNGNGNGQGDVTRLYHAGHATRSDINSTLALQLHEYGVYSTNFSFSSGVGLPGRVFGTGRPSWETRVNEQDPVIFERTGGAKIYGVKTALGIPLESPSVGRMVLAFYSTKEITSNPVLIDKYVSIFGKLMPEPKWQLVIDVGSDANYSNGSSGSGAAFEALLMDTPRNPCPLTQPPVSRTVPDTNTTAIPNWKNYKTPPLAPQSAPSAMLWQRQSTSPQMSLENADDEQRIANLLGQYMPVIREHSPGSGGESLLIQHFISLRLLLLRSSDQRSKVEQDLLHILIKSFRGYSNDNRRSGAELAALLAKDWMFLLVNYLPVSPVLSTAGKTIMEQPHQCHILAAPSLTSTMGLGALAPPPLGHSYPSNHLMTNSFVTMQHYQHPSDEQRDRRVSDDEIPPVNILAEL